MQKTDRELLELAAKAVGIDGEYFEENKMIREFCFQKVAFIKTKAGEWNPLIDDGDRYRLAAKLGLCVDFENGMICYRGDLVRDSVQDIDRAIVEVAAEIGEAMP